MILTRNLLLWGQMAHYLWVPNRKKIRTWRPAHPLRASFLGLPWQVDASCVRLLAVVSAAGSIISFITVITDARKFFPHLVFINCKWFKVDCADAMEPGFSSSLAKIFDKSILFSFSFIQLVGSNSMFLLCSCSRKQRVMLSFLRSLGFILKPVSERGFNEEHNRIHPCESWWDEFGLLDGGSSWKDDVST